MFHRLVVPILATAQVAGFTAGTGSPKSSAAAIKLLMSSIANRDLKGVQIAIKEGAELNSVTQGNQTPILAALSSFVFIENQHQKDQARTVLNYLFSKGARLSGHRDELFLAVISKDISLMALLLDHGLNPHDKAYGYTSIELAYINRADALIPLLKSRNVPDIPPEFRPVMKIMRAIKGNDQEDLEKLIQDKGAINQYDPSGRTPLTAILGDISWITTPAVFITLLSAQPDFNLPSKYEEDYGRYPLHMLASTMTLDSKYAGAIADYISIAILHLHADPNVVDELQQTPLHVAAEVQYPQIASALLKCGANPLVVDFRGRRPSTLASTPEVRGLLLEAEKAAIIAAQKGSRR